MKFINYFNLSNSTYTGGQTGSVRVLGKDGKYYQYKPSILQNTLFRRWKTGFTDRENFGEVIASFIGRSLLSEDMVPEVSLVYDTTNKSVAVASKYLGDGTKIDDYAFNHRNIPRSPARSHVLLTYGSTKTNELSKLSLENSGLTISDVFNTLALSAIVGDNDVNPGNLVVVKRDEGHRVARIDLGHAFRDLLNAPRSFGGGLRILNHPVLDFFNRQNVAGGKFGGDISKFKRDYLGFVPTFEMVQSLRNISKVNREKVVRAVKDARREFDALIRAMQNNNDELGIAHIKKSLSAIYTSIKNTTISSDFTLDLVLDFTMDAILKSTLENMSDAEKVANVMELQLEINAAVAEDREISARGMELIDADIFPKDAFGQILWVSVENEPGFRGSWQRYLEYIANKGNVSLLKPLLSNSFMKNKNEVTRGVSHNSDTPWIEIDLNQLLDKLAAYLTKVESEKEATLRFSGFSKEEKKQAVTTLINVLNGKEAGSTLSTYLPVLNDGRLGKLIKEAIKPNSIRDFIERVQAETLSQVHQSSKRNL